MIFTGFCIGGPTPRRYVSASSHKLTDPGHKTVYTHRVLTKFPDGQTLEAWVPPGTSNISALQRLMDAYVELNKGTETK